jgi:hypothetical protein
MPTVRDREGQQYVVTQKGHSQIALRPLLERYPFVQVLGERAGMALVEMPEDTCRRVSQDHPELIVEENIEYRKQG